MKNFESLLKEIGKKIDVTLEEAPNKIKEAAEKTEESIKEATKNIKAKINESDVDENINDIKKDLEDTLTYLFFNIVESQKIVQVESNIDLNKYFPDNKLLSIKLKKRKKRGVVEVIVKNTDIKKRFSIKVKENNLSMEDIKVQITEENVLKLIFKKQNDEK